MNNRKTIIELHDTPMSAMVKMSMGNPGAATALASLWKSTEKVDPDNAFGGLGTVLSLDTAGIYGTDIYILWSDICNRNDVHVLMLLRAVQLGHLSESVFRDAAHRQDGSGKALIDIPALYAKVKKDLPNFDKN